MKYFDEFIETLRELRSRKGFISIVLITLSVTLSALLLTFNFNYTFIVKALPYPESDEIYVLDTIRKEDGKQYSSYSHTLPGLMKLYKSESENHDIALASSKFDYINNAKRRDKVLVTSVTPEYFRILDAPMAKGQMLSGSGKLSEARREVVISHNLWLSLFGGNSDILNKKIAIGSESFSIVGVTDKGYVEPGLNPFKTSIWTHWNASGYSRQELEDWNDFKSHVSAFARIKGRKNIREVRDEFSERVNFDYQRSTNRDYDSLEVELIPIKQVLLGDSKVVAIAFLSVSIMLMIVAFLNIINMFYSKIVENQVVLAIKTSVGAKRKDIFNSIFMESFIFTFSACCIGLLTANYLSVFLSSLPRSMFRRLDEIGVGVPTTVFTLFLAVLLAYILAILSVRIIRFDKIKDSLRSGKGGGVQVPRKKRHILICLQVFLATVIVCISSIIINKCQSILGHPSGFNFDGVYSVEFEKTKSSSIDRYAFMSQLNDEIIRLPNVSDSSPSFTTPLEMRVSKFLYDVTNRRVGGHVVNYISENYFRMFGVQVVRGRYFTEKEVRDNSPLVLVSESSAMTIGRGDDVLGKYVSTGGEKQYKIIGVVSDIYIAGRPQKKQSLDIYIPYVPSEKAHYLIKMDRPNTTISKSELIRAVDQVSMYSGVSRVISLKELYNQKVFVVRMVTYISTMLAALIVFLAFVGVFGVVKYNVQVRKYEVGIHMALGAKRLDIFRLIGFDNIFPASLACLVGFITSFVCFSMVKKNTMFLSDVGISSLLIGIPMVAFPLFLAVFIPIYFMIKRKPISALRSE